MSLPVSEGMNYSQHPTSETEILAEIEARLERLEQCIREREALADVSARVEQLEELY